ncbi:MAG: sulfatase, partial [Candidatus Krumholzibacteriia bacterium]
MADVPAADPPTADPPSCQAGCGRRGRACGVVAATLLRVVLLLACLAPACGPRRSGTHHVIVVLVDTLRHDALGCYGNPWRSTPHIDALAAEGVRFDQAISSSGWTLPAVASLFTGAWPQIHGGLGKDVVLTPIRDEIPTAAEVFRAAGFNTIGLANAAFVSPLLRLDRGFDVFDHRYAYNWEIRRADETIDEALRLIRARGKGSSFVFIHLFDPHLDYDPPPEYATRFTRGRHEPTPPLSWQACQDLRREGGQPPTTDDLEYVGQVYLGEVGFIDAQIGRLVDELRGLGLYERTTLVITSDHGEEFWDHGGFEHGHTLYDELIRIPLILKPASGFVPVRRVVDEQVRIIDVMPTVFDLLEIDPPETFEGVSLLPLVQGRQTVERPAFGEGTLYGADKLCWRTSRYK